MEIKIISLTIHNFKGIRDASFRFGGSNATIEGENGTGKSTVFDAFTWLLFGKDHQGQDWTNFDLKPIDPETREPLHGLEHWVEAELTIDGTPKTLKRVVTEDWVKPRGEAEKVLKGHKQAFFIDGVDTATKKAYDAAVGQWIDEGVFKLLTNPLYFIDDQYTDWKSRRKAILSLLPAQGQAELRESFADLIAEMRGEPMEQFRKRVAAEKKVNRDRLSEATAKVAAFRETLPKEVDRPKVVAEIQALTEEKDAAVSKIRAQIAIIDNGIADINAANADKRSQADALHREVLQLRRKEQEIVDRALAAAREEEAARKAEYYAAQSAAAARKKAAQRAAQEREEAEIEAQRLAAERAKHAAELKRLGDQYQGEKEKAFVFNVEDEEICPTCGQPLPQSILESKREEACERFKAARKDTLNAIIGQASLIKDTIRRIDERAAELAHIMEDNDTSLESASVEVAEEPPATDYNEVARQARLTDEYKILAAEDNRLTREAEEIATRTTSVDDLLNDRRALEKEIQKLNEEYDRRSRHLRDFLAVDEERKRITALIEKTEAQSKTFADELARLERLEFRATEYTKAEIDSQEGAINALFRVVRWKMFAPTLEGGLTEMCEVTDLKGIPFRSMNDAQKILCGLDVIRVFSQHNDVSAPIFVDNAESITRTEFDTPAQVIRLVVKAGSPLTTINQ